MQRWKDDYITSPFISLIPFIQGRRQQLYFPEIPAAARKKGSFYFRSSWKSIAGIIWPESVCTFCLWQKRRQYICLAICLLLSSSLPPSPLQNNNSPWQSSRLPFNSPSFPSRFISLLPFSPSCLRCIGKEGDERRKERLDVCGAGVFLLLQKKGSPQSPSLCYVRTHNVLLPSDSRPHWKEEEGRKRQKRGRRRR